MLASAVSSSSSGARASHCCSRCDMISASSPSIRQYAPRSAPSTPPGTVVSTPSSGSAKPVPNAHRRPLSASSVIASYAVSNGNCSSLGGTTTSSPRNRHLNVRDRVGDVVEGGVAVDLVAARREERVLLVGTGRGDVGRADHPDAHALVAPGVQVPRVVQRHGRVGRVQRANVHVVQPPFPPQEHLPQRPLRPVRLPAAHASPSRPVCFAA